MSCGVSCRCGSDPTLLWLWCRPAASAQIRPLAWEPPYATGSGPRKGKKTKKITTNSVIIMIMYLHEFFFLLVLWSKENLWESARFVVLIKLLNNWITFVINVLSCRIFFFFLLGSHLQNMEVSRLGVNLELQLLTYATATAMLDPSHSATYTAAHGNAGSLTHWSRPGIKPAFSWVIVEFLTCWTATGTPSHRI